MPIVPTYKEQQVSSSPLPNNGFSVQSSPEHFGAGFGQVTEQYAGVFAEAKQRADVALSQDALLQLQEYSDDLMNNPKTGLYTKLGRNAMGQSDETLNNIRSKAGELMDSLPEGKSREDFLKQSNVLGRQYHNQAKMFELRETQAFETSVNNGLVEGNLKNAQDSYSDPQAFNSYIALAEHNYVEFNRARGVSDEEIAVNVEKIRNGAAWGAAQNYMASAPVQALSAIGEPSDVGGSMRVPGNIKDNRGGRNNNPGNLRISDNIWDGQIGDDGEFVQFASPEHGVRALGKNLITYRNKGFVTVNQIINRWAPKKDNNATEEYVAFVSQRMGVDPNVPIDVTNIDTLKSITTAIMAQEGKHSITDDQVNTGLQAALGLTRLPDVDKSLYQPEIRKAQGGGFPWWPMLTPVQQYQLIKQGNAAQKEQQRERKAITDDDFDNAIAAYERGEDAPNAPSRDRLVDANGEYEGQKKYVELQDAQRYSVLMASAKDMSPNAQYDLVQKSKPSVDDPDYKLKIQRWDKFNKWVNANIIEQDKIRATNELAAARRNKFPLDPNNKNNQEAANAAFDREIFPSFSITNPDSLNETAKFMSDTGMIPDRVGSYFSAASMSKDPSIVVPMAKVYGQVFDSNPAALASMDSKSGGYFKTIYDLTTAGMKEDEAVSYAYSQVYEQSEEKKKLIRDITTTKDYASKVDKYAQKTINSMSPSWYFGIPSTADTNNPMWSYLADYRTAYQANFFNVGGNEEVAKSVTDVQIKKKWGVTELNGKEELMRYAPEAVYGINSSNAGNWVLSQWQDEKETLKPLVKGGMADGDDFILVSDAITAKNSDYAIVVKRVSKEGVPQLELMHGANGLPMRFKPDQQSSSMYLDLIAENKSNISKANDKRSKYQSDRKYYEGLANELMDQNIPNNDATQKEIAERTAKNIEQSKADKKRREEEAKQRRIKLNQQVEDERKNNPAFSSIEKTVNDMLKNNK
ncbi:hypothetical protein [Providencia rettgeri]|uniref:Uncharacterized protein n=1 Tax=Providencia rettgeri TaxID=587 RepID=A0A9N8D1D0_PRORE|nr:hypothetical protein [Providencia rettgeri]CAB5642938.1 Uncharacterised protein [Providencia rettgeri]CAB5679090.1 Uncharacterised protein [Providencia rettgeri]CAC9243838.1 Uncharacterised protein [Providencia rettgeri]CAC9247420.1 Uncharacterised protein [Providencia rettgeri]